MLWGPNFETVKKLRDILIFFTTLPLKCLDLPQLEEDYITYRLCQSCDRYVAVIKRKTIFFDYVVRPNFWNRRKIKRHLFFYNTANKIHWLISIISWKVIGFMWFKNSPIFIQNEGKEKVLIKKKASKMFLTS